MLKNTPGIGPKTLEKLASLGLRDLADFLFYLPLRYEDRTRLRSISQLEPFQSQLFTAEVISSQVQQGRRKSFMVVVGDQSGRISLRFYHYAHYFTQKFKKGSLLLVFGVPRRGTTGLEVYHPEVTFQTAGTAVELSDRLTAIYPSTEGIQQRQWRQLMDSALAQVDHLLEPLVPPDIEQALGLPSLCEALNFVHHPPIGFNAEQLRQGEHPALQRLIIEELAAHHLALKALRLQLDQWQAPPWHPTWTYDQDLLKKLPFSLTQAQLRVISEIEADLQNSHPMNRLVQGDVGSGKTLVALMAMLKVANNGQQAALMAPTEILAEQHGRNLSGLCSALGIKTALLLGRQSKKEKAEQLALIASGEALLVVGTHALLQPNVVFHHLALVVIDEQHRFGVDQRLQLLTKGEFGCQRPHQLTMTATPIPRTLAMSLYADMAVSAIDELPPGRQPITTRMLSTAKRQQLIERVGQACQNGRQVYWVCTLIESNEEIAAEAAEDLCQQLQEALPHTVIGLVHGKLKSAEKAKVMSAFVDGQIQLLVATTVIEVGVDVPNSSIMVIEDADRLGLAQLHQLRGRVGRGTADSYCMLLYKPPLSQTGRARLQTMVDSQDGFVIAEQDLLLRGPGEVLGTRQTGEAEMKIANLQRDLLLLEPSRQMAEHLLQHQPQNAAKLVKRWHAGNLHFGTV